jgi:hypothetical protein
MRVTTASQERFSACGYTRSKQWMAPRPRVEKLQRLYKITPSRSDEMAKNDLEHFPPMLIHNLRVARN